MYKSILWQYSSYKYMCVYNHSLISCFRHGYMDAERALPRPEETAVSEQCLAQVQCLCFWLAEVSLYVWHGVDIQYL